MAEGGTITVVLMVLIVVIIWRGFDLAFMTVVVVYAGLLVVNVIGNAIWDDVEYQRILPATALVVCLILAVSAGILARVVGGAVGSWAIAVVALLGGIASGRSEGGLAGIIIAASLVIISKRAVRGDPRDRALRAIAFRLVRRWGTQFRRADLSGADFTGADGSRCDVRGANLVDVRWDPAFPLPLDLPDDNDPA